MAFPKYDQLNSLTTSKQIEDEILILQKNLFDFRMKKAMNQDIKPHVFLHTKRRIAQLNFKKYSLLKTNI